MYITALWANSGVQPTLALHINTLHLNTMSEISKTLTAIMRIEALPCTESLSYTDKLVAKGKKYIFKTTVVLELRTTREHMRHKKELCYGLLDPMTILIEE
jgi:hypothetical protein